MASKIRARNPVAMEAVLVPVLIVLTFSFGFACAGVDVSSSHREEEKWSVDHHVAVKGRVFCDPCLDHQFPSLTANFLPGALVAVECSINNSNRKLRSTTISTKAETDEYGEFRVELPTCTYNLDLNPMTSCSVRLLNSPHRSCNIPSISTSSLIPPSNANGLARTYTSHPLSYRVRDVPHSLCTSTQQEEEIMVSSEPRGRGLKESSSTSKATSTPPLPNAPSMPKLSVPPLRIPNTPLLNAPPVNTIPPLPNAPPLPKLNVPPLSTPNSPALNLPNAPPITITKFSFPPLPSLTPPPLPKPRFLPPLPSFTPPPPPPSTDNHKP